MRFPWSRHDECAADLTAYCVRRGCRRNATHARPLAISAAGDLIEELTCCALSAAPGDTHRDESVRVDERGFRGHFGR
ncbi:hypothetical protein [Kribbella sp. NPDC048915]|uniref:hypothetical protein n=1 Tax=Kribbella sp. NPDC048915 TaxID=3155148 RepID=UPI0033FAAF5F